MSSTTAQVQQRLSTLPVQDTLATNTAKRQDSVNQDRRDYASSQNANTIPNETLQDTPRNSEHPTELARPSVLYGVHVFQGSNPGKWYYSDKRFTRPAEGPSERKQNSFAKFELSQDVRAFPKKGVEPKRAMQKSEWARADLCVNLSEDYDVEFLYDKQLEIYSQPVCAALRYLIPYDPGRILEGNNCIWTRSPHYLLLHYYEAIANLAHEVKDVELPLPRELAKYPREDLSEELTQLLQILEPEYLNIFLPAAQMYQKDMGGVTFKNLFLLFKPGDQVYAKMDGELSAFIVCSLWELEESPKEVVISLWNYRYVSGVLQRHVSNVHIPFFSGSRLITSLEVYPCRFLPHKDRIRVHDKLVSQGRKFLQLVSSMPRHKQYNGMTLGVNGLTKSIHGSRSGPRFYKGHIMLDPVSFVNSATLGMLPPTMHDNREYDPLVESDISLPQDFGGGRDWQDFCIIDPTDPEIFNRLEERHYVLFPRRIRGMSLTEKQWETYDIGNISDVEWEKSDTVLERLIIDPEAKEIIKATCRGAQSRKTSPDISTDWIRGKGAGQIFLFHGSPGTGKTMAVECIAQYTHQPIVSLSGADLNVGELDRKLDLWFSYAMQWDALLLIDEAEVYMEQRASKDMDRSAIVTVFLRKIEYYSGMLFLTTNRIGAIDTAIKSRIQVSIHFSDFDKRGRQQLWKAYFKKLRDENSPAAPTPGVEKALLNHEILEVELNGRDIRNALQHAIRITRLSETQDINRINEGDKFGLQLEHIVSAIRMREELTTAIVRAHHVNNERELAAERNDMAFDDEEEERSSKRRRVE